MQLLTLIESSLIRSEKEIEGISELKLLYTDYYIKLEQLWIETYHGNITQDEAKDSYFKFRKKDWKRIETEDAKYSIKNYRKMREKSEKEVDNHLNKFYNYEQEE